MALGIDIYRYQTVTDWQAVKRHGVSFVYVKGTDGGRPAIARADGQTRGAQEAGLPVGLYHYAQLTPSPEAQADVLTAEVHRLEAYGLPPALDLEDPHKPGPAAREFARRFLARLRDNGFSTVCLYANTSMLTGITADTIGVPNTVIWAAAYGRNDGGRHPLTYRGRVNIHQYTSVGLVPGISGRVDLNESLTAIPSASKGDDDMPLTKADAQLVAAEVWETQRKHLDPANGLTLPMWIWLVGANQGAWAAANRPFPLPTEVDEEKVAEHLATLLIGPLTQVLREQDGYNEEDAETMVTALARRLAGQQVERLRAAQSTEDGSNG